jgi:hypothetical protein
MVEFSVWFKNLVSECKLIASPDSLTRAWINKEPGITCAYDFIELSEQILGDLDLENEIQGLLR